MPERPVELARCDEHGLTMTENPDGRLNYCIACGTGLEVRLDDDVGGPPLRDGEFRSRLTEDVVEEVVPLMREYLADVEDEVEMWVTHDKWENELPAGYSEQERYIPVIGYRFGARVKYLTERNSAEETIETLKENGYGDA